MAANLICPDCGGALGPAEPGVTSCACFSEESFSPSDFQQPAMDDSLSDTHPVETLSKVCFRCGTDVAGKKRYKDSRGYMCADCNRAEVDGEKAGTIPCAECGRRVKEAGLVEFRGLRICKLCLADQRESEKKRVKLVSGKTFEAQDRKTLKVLVIILIVLAFFIVLSLIKTHRG